MSREDCIRILIADDEAGFLKALTTYLAKPWREILTARNGAEAISVLESSEVDLVVTDLVMPRVDGLGVLGRVVESGSRTLVILMTGYGSIETAVRAVSQGAFDYKTKPFLLEEMGLAVARAEAHLRLVRERDRLLAERDSLAREIHELKTLAISQVATGTLPPRTESLRLDVLERAPSAREAFSWYRMWQPDTSLEEEITLLTELRNQGLLTHEQWIRLRRRMTSACG
jgi:DNA-binding response OmpR family regulator